MQNNRVKNSSEEIESQNSTFLHDENRVEYTPLENEEPLNVQFATNIEESVQDNINENEIDVLHENNIEDGIQDYLAGNDLHGENPIEETIQNVLYENNVDDPPPYEVEENNIEDGIQDYLAGNDLHGENPIEETIQDVLYENNVDDPPPYEVEENNIEAPIQDIINEEESGLQGKNNIIDTTEDFINENDFGVQDVDNIDEEPKNIIDENENVIKDENNIEEAIQNGKNENETAEQDEKVDSIFTAQEMVSENLTVTQDNDLKIEEIDIAQTTKDLPSEHQSINQENEPDIQKIESLYTANEIETDKDNLKADAENSLILVESLLNLGSQKPTSEDVIPITNEVVDPQEENKSKSQRRSQESQKNTVQNSKDSLIPEISDQKDWKPMYETTNQFIEKQAASMLYKGEQDTPSRNSAERNNALDYKRSSGNISRNDIESQTSPIKVDAISQATWNQERGTQMNIGHSTARSPECSHRLCIQLGFIISLLFFLLGYLMHNCVDNSMNQPSC